MIFQIVRLEKILLLQDDNALLRLSWTLTLRPATKIFVLVQPSIRILYIDLDRTVSLVAVPSLLMCRDIVGASSGLLDDHSTPSPDIVSHLCSASAIWKA